MACRRLARPRSDARAARGAHNFARCLAAAAALLLVGAGCDAADDGAGPAQAAEHPSGTTGAGPDRPPPATAPLTGLPLGGAGADDAARSGPVVAVKVGNEPSARPQAGLADAEVVFVTPVEGGGTRLAALYHTTLPERVGPVRSGREHDADLLVPFDPLFAYAGAAPPALAALQGAGLALREEGQPARAWRRDPARPAPHNLFLLPRELPEGRRGATAPVSGPWPIATEGIEGARGERAGGVRLRFSALHEAEWHWEDDARRWTRGQDGEAHVDADGNPVVAANVVVARVDARSLDRVDAAGNPVVDLVTEGSGEALVLRDGRVVDGRWERDPGGTLSWRDVDGEPLELLPGRTWVEFVPTGGRVEVLPATVG